MKRAEGGIVVTQNVATERLVRRPGSAHRTAVLMREVKRPRFDQPDARNDPASIPNCLMLRNGDL
jgi:hypothetical protein